MTQTLMVAQRRVFAEGLLDLAQELAEDNSDSTWTAERVRSLDPHSADMKLHAGAASRASVVKPALYPSPAGGRP
jgi:hypothetical protein